MPGVLHTSHCVRRSASFPFFKLPDDNLLLILLLPGVVTGVDGATGAGGGGGGGSLGTGGGGVISVLVDVATNICGLDSDAISPSGRGIGLICK